MMRPKAAGSAILGATILATVFCEPTTGQPPPCSSSSATLSQFERQPPNRQPSAQPLARITDFSDWVTALAFSPDGKTLAAGTYELVKLFDTATRQPTGTLKVKGYARSLAYSPDGKLLAAGAYQMVMLWDAQTHKPLRALKGHRAYVTGIGFSPDGKLLATSSEDETIRLWDVSTGEQKRLIDGHSYPVMDVAFSPDGRLLASVAGDETRVTRPGEVRIWDAVTGAEKFDLVQHEKAATSLAFSPDGKYLATTGEDEKVNLYDVSTGKALGYYDGHGRATNDVLFAADGELVISAGGGRAAGKNDVRIWTRDEGQDRATLSGHTGQVACLALAPDGKTLASGSYDETVIFWDISSLLPAWATLAKLTPVAAPVPENGSKVLRAGLIGLDTSHVIAFTRLLNDPEAGPELAGVKVVAGYPGGTDIPASANRVERFTEQLRGMGIEIVDSIPELLKKVDVVLLESVDGRPHLEQAIPVIQAGKPLFIDKPVAGSLADAVAIFRLAEEHNVPVFSSSSLRYSEGAQALRNGKVGEVLGCDAYSPCSLEPTHPDLFWYGIHGVESLFTVMGTGCQSVTRTHTPEMDVVVGAWKGGRIGTFRGIRKGKSGYGGTAFGTKGIAPIGPYGGYKPLLVEIVKFFQTGKPPVDAEETLEIYAFMQAADESKRQGGVPVRVEEVLNKARKAAADKLAKLE